MASHVMQVFWDLAELEEPKRVSAAATLITHLANAQVAEPGLNGELEYCLGRLVKGLASSRLAARQGFSMALTELLTVIPVVRIYIRAGCDWLGYVCICVGAHGQVSGCHG